MQNKLLYRLDDKTAFTANLLYGLQWAAFTLSSNIFYPLVAGAALGLPAAEHIAFIQRTIFVIGLASFLQVIFGHRLPLIEGVAGLWFSIFLLFAQTAITLGQNPIQLLPQIEFSFILVGIITLLFSIGGMLNWLQSLFTPLVTGSTLILLSFQVSGSFLKGMLGFQDGVINWQVALLSFGITALVSYFGYRGSKWIRSISALLGMVIGWAIYNLLRFPQTMEQPANADQLFFSPKLFSWGFPQYSSGILITAIVTAIVLISNQVASIVAVEEALGECFPQKIYKKSGIVNGIVHIISGCFASMGTIPYAISAGFIGLTGIGARLPFLFSTLVVMLAGLIWPVGKFFSQIPTPIAYAVTFATFSQMISYGLVNYTKVEMNQRNFLIIGFTLLIGVGLMFIPPTAYSELPIFMQNLLSNGLLMGIMIVLFLEHIVFKAPKSVKQ
jgi:xanthine/uracil permease